VITVRRAVAKRCPFRDETDTGELVITVPGDAPELHQLAGQVDALCAEQPVSHEDFTRAVAALLPAGATVATSWRTGPWTVEVTEP
jgi:hypothetical protein